MGISVEKYTLDSFVSMRKLKTIEVSPDIQRRTVWSDRSRMLFIDSLARRVPVGAITLYKDESGKYARYEVIDGKQRLSALFDYLDGEFVVKKSEVLKADDDELSDIGIELAEPLYETAFGDLDQDTTISLLQYSIPVFEVSGSRDQAVQAFTRMNRNSYVLTPQEIRNAVYAKSVFLAASASTSVEFTERIPTETDCAFVSLGVITEKDFDRMKDIQLASELITLALGGEQHRRDSLNSMYDKYANPGRAATQELSEAVHNVGQALDQIVEIFGPGRLQGYSFPSNCEHDLYALVGALLSRGLFSKPQMHLLADHLQETLGEFRRQATVYIDDAKSGNTSATAHAPSEVGRYARSFLSGQVNALSRRVDRREALVVVLNEVADAPSKDTFSSQTRALIWASKAEKACARCGTPVAYDDYHAGHMKAKALGGLPVLSNGQIEHESCNLAAGAG